MTPAQILQTAGPVIGFFVVAFIGYFIKITIERQMNAKRSENHVYVHIIPKAGKWKAYLRPIESVGGVAMVRIPDAKGKVGPSSSTYILGEEGMYPCDYPIGRPKYVQATVQSATYYEGDAEPLSNVTGRPIISEQLFTNIINGISSAVNDLIHKSQEESGLATKKTGNLWMYLLIIVGIALTAVTLIVLVKNTNGLGDVITWAKQALGK